MLKITTGKKRSFCDNVSRRGFLQLGALTLGGLTLSDLIAAEESAGVGSSHKAVINIHLGGGPSHQDMFDLKPNAPVEFRGEFNPIDTNVSGMQICEHFPLLAKMADKFAVIRSVVGSSGQHSNAQTHTGYDRNNLINAGGRPALGSVVSKLQGPHMGAPPFISYNKGESGFLGPVHKPYSPKGGSLTLNRGLTPERLSSRTNLLESLDSLRRESDNSGQMHALDKQTRTAVELVTSGRVARALDLKQEDPRRVERYAKDGQNFLLARRLIQAGVRVVTLNWGSWDTHSGNFTKLKTQLPKLDIAMSALLEDLEIHGLSNDVSVVMWGEFGRTPRVNKNAGRDHWRQVMGAFVAGGGMKLGQAIGASTPDGGEAMDRPVQLQEIIATLYHNLGIDAESVTLPDSAGRPQYLVDHRRPMPELV